MFGGVGRRNGRKYPYPLLYPPGPASYLSAKSANQTNQAIQSLRAPPNLPLPARTPPPNLLPLRRAHPSRRHLSAASPPLAPCSGGRVPLPLARGRLAAARRRRSAARAPRGPSPPVLESRGGRSSPAPAAARSPVAAPSTCRRPPSPAAVRDAATSAHRHCAVLGITVPRRPRRRFVRGVGVVASSSAPSSRHQRRRNFAKEESLCPSPDLMANSNLPRLIIKDTGSSLNSLLAWDAQIREVLLQQLSISIFWHLFQSFSL
ncbi:SH3 domain-binding protein 1-like [Panicum virgatum]|uniref:SH3 domain-binding protein 1-like n=1 Tax=Panicum virgatum TaxID=38727 RepID=UPI0019D64348|nr:SH3 domain-binding protein 1-like [Panicum virgatum]